MILINGAKIIPTRFPDGTSQIWQLPESTFRRHVFVDWKFEHEGELIGLIQLKDLLNMKGCSADLNMDYLPYARQDKEISNESTFGLRSFAKVINSLGFREITCVDPHSPVALEQIKGLRPTYPLELISKIIQDNKYDLVCYPDAGAVNKYAPMINVGFIFGTKVRCSNTGIISSFALTGNPANKSILIIDDICDGGATFVFLAKALFECGSKKVDLFVSHGLFTNGFKPLKEAGISKIFTKDGEINDTSNIV